MEGLTIALNNNVCQYTTGDGQTLYAKPVMGTAMGPAHSCDYVDVFMGKLDKELVDHCPVPLLTSLLPPAVRDREEYRALDWNRFRDDGLIILLDEAHVSAFEQHLQTLCPPHIKWTVSHGQEATYLDIHLTIREGKIITDVFSKHCHSYLPPTSCHAPAVFKGLISGVGTRLRMICSEDDTLENRIQEYARYFAMAGWEYSTALRELRRGANRNRKELLTKPRKKKPPKIAWVSKYDPRVPSKSAIIRKNLHLLYQDNQNKKIFPKNLIIGADRRRRNLGELYKPTVPKCFREHGPKEAPGFVTCTRKCDTCAHSKEMHSFQSPWDGRRWTVKKHLTCTTPNLVYLLTCKLHPDEGWYIGSCKDLKARWRNHKSDCKRKLTKKCSVAYHCSQTPHPLEGNLDFLQIVAIDSAQSEEQLRRLEAYYIGNIGTLFVGLNSRNELHGFSH